MSIRVLALLLAAAAGLLAGAPALAQVPVQIPPVQVPPAGVPSTSDAGLTQGTFAWQRTDYSDGSSVAPADPSNYTLTFRPDGRAAIQADCNTGSAGYTLNGSSLMFTAAAVSLVACPPGSLDTVFLRDLSQVASFDLNGGELTLHLATNAGAMTFSAMAPPTLTGVTWRVTGVNNGRGGVVSVVSGTQPSAVFGEDGRVSGDTGCNTFTGTYMIAGDGISFGQLATTRRACLSDDANAQEQQLLAALEATTRYELFGDRLTLRDAAGATQVTLVRPVN